MERMDASDPNLDPTRDPTAGEALGHDPTKPVMTIGDLLESIPPKE